MILALQPIAVGAFDGGEVVVEKSSTLMENWLESLSFMRDYTFVLFQEGAATAENEKFF